MSVFRVCVVLLLCVASLGRCIGEAVVGSADVVASAVSNERPVDVDGVPSSVPGSGRVAALLSPTLAACVVKAQPGLARFIRSHAADYPALTVVYTGDTPRLQVFHSEQHRRDNIVDSSQETDEQLMLRLSSPHSLSHTHTRTRALARTRQHRLPSRSETPQTVPVARYVSQVRSIH